MTTPYLRTPEIVQGEIKELYRTSVLTWEEMAALRQYNPIPAGTLCAIANGADVPKKWYKKLRVQTTRARSLRPPTKEFRIDDMDKMSRSIIKTLTPAQVETLIDNLIIDSRYPSE